MAEKFKVQEENKPRPLIPPGEYIFTLQEVKLVQVRSQYGRQTNEKGEKVADKYLWIFVANENDEEGNPYEYTAFTNLVYGDAKATLTHLLDMLVPGITKESAVNLAPDDLYGKRFHAMIKHTVFEGKTYAKHVYLTPLRETEVKSGSKRG